MKVPAVAALLAASQTHLSNAFSNFTHEAKEFHELTSTALEKGLANLSEREHAARANDRQPSCTRENVTFRKEYGALTREEKLDYVQAVQCLQNLPPRTPANVSSGARSRFDDFVVVHIQQTLQIHFSGIFQPWHRWFVYSYEKALREECGYKGYQPYWDWPKYADAPQDSPLFDGSDTCLGGNGDFIEHEGPLLVSPSNSSLTLQLPPGLGSGNVTTGPFANMTVNLGPFGGLNNTEPGPNGGLGYNPRRLKRDVGPAVNERYANYSTVLNLLQKPNISEYRILSEGIPYVEIGPHGGIHYVISGDPGGDLFTSPGDPAFYTHHSMMDRMWTYWQLLGCNGERYTEPELNGGVYGHLTWENTPESRKALFTDVIDMGYAAESTTIGNVMDTLAGPFCYLYI